MKNIFTCCLLLLLTNLSFGQAPANDNIADAEVITLAGSLTVSGTTIDATKEIPFPNFPYPTCTGFSDPENGSVWYTFNGDGNEYSFSTCNGMTDFDTRIDIFTSNGIFGGVYALMCANDGGAPAINYSNDNGDGTECAIGGVGGVVLSRVSAMTTILTPTTQYFLRVSNGFNALDVGGDFDLVVEQIVAAPVKLVNFWGAEHERGNSIMWETSSEENVLWHIIERSSNGARDWEEVGRLVSETTAANGAFYEMIDQEPYNETFYRLRTVDYDGSEQKSSLISIQRAKPDFEVTKIYPNPINQGIVTIQIDSDRNESIGIRIMDLAGKTMVQYDQDIRDGKNEIELEISDWRAGIYFIQFDSRQGYITRKLVMQE